MNIKRALLALSAMILGVGFFGASSAQATPHYTPVPPCIDWNVASTVWAPANAGDTHFFICDGSYQNHANPSPFAISGVRNATQAQSAVVRQKMLNNNVDVFVFKNHTDYNNYVGPLAQHADATNRGMTVEKMMPLGPHTGIAIAIFETFCANPPSGCVTADYTNASRALNHEVGHAVDIVMGYPSLLTGPGKFKTQFELDVNAFNALVGPVNFSGIPPACNTGSNYDKLSCWLNVPDAVGNDDRYLEMFAHCYSGKRASGGYPAPAVAILNSYFSTGGMAPSSTVRSCSIADAAAQTP